MVRRPQGAVECLAVLVIDVHAQAVVRIEDPEIAPAPYVGLHIADAIKRNAPMLCEENLTSEVDVFPLHARRILVVAQIADIARHPLQIDVGAGFDAPHRGGVRIDPGARKHRQALDRRDLGGDHPVRLSLLKTAAGREHRVGLGSVAAADQQAAAASVVVEDRGANADVQPLSALIEVVAGEFVGAEQVGFVEFEGGGIFVRDPRVGVGVG